MNVSATTTKRGTCEAQRSAHVFSSLRAVGRTLKNQ